MSSAMPTAKVRFSRALRRKDEDNQGEGASRKQVAVGGSGGIAKPQVKYQHRSRL
jgi:hypothetical protein